jgi:hypothetical protein
MRSLDTGYQNPNYIVTVPGLESKGMIPWGTSTEIVSYAMRPLSTDISKSSLYNIISAILISISDINEKINLKLYNETNGVNKIYTVPINSFGIEKYELKKSILISVEEKNSNDFIACFYDADIYGYGDSLIEAIDDLKSCIISQFDSLNEEIEQGYELGPIPSKQLTILKEFINRG